MMPPNMLPHQQQMIPGSFPGMQMGIGIDPFSDKIASEVCVFLLMLIVLFVNTICILFDFIF